ncbi:MAG: UDP-N-acetylglucosamine 2-epimerase [Phycisphaerales bacterium JB059]
MIGDGWTDSKDELARDRRPTPDAPRRVAIVTGTRAEFGLLKPVMEAVRDRPELELLVVAAGAHLIQPAETFREIKKHFEVADSVPMQTVGRTGRWADVEALGKGVARFGRSFERLAPEWVVVLGDRIEAFAAASAASVGGIAVCHIHGGDRAEGVADEAMRHAITKLAHLHLAASEQSAERIRRMGERPEHVRVIGSPAIDALDRVEPLDDESFEALGAPELVLLTHPIGRTEEAEEHATSLALESLGGAPTLALHPNHDPGREGVLRALLGAGGNVTLVKHLDRSRFVGLLKRIGASGGALVGNSSAGLIEAGALGCPAVNIGVRQSGREHGDNVVHAPESVGAIREALEKARSLRAPFTRPFGEGGAGVRAASALVEINPLDPGMVRKHCAY